MVPHLIIDIEGVLVSSEIFSTFFLCDLGACKGACCIEGDSGAPVTPEEERLMKDAFPIISKYLRKEVITVIEDEGVAYSDEDGDRVTTLYRGAECAFTCFEHDGSARCSFEKGHTEGISPCFYKPLSCHLYPIRVTPVGDTVALNYHRWKPICEPARKLGREKGVRLYRFLRDPLIRAFGEEWYAELSEAAEVYLKEYAS